jgi:glycosyltransferase involved in cell wall biosynthesis
MNFSVIICAHTEKRWDDLVEAVDSIERQSLPAHQIIVVIDHNPALFERAKARFTGADVVENQENRGLSGARNTGMAVVKGDVMAFIDDDAVAQADWLEKLAEGYQNESIAGVGGFIEAQWLSGRPKWFPIEFDWVVGCSYRGLPEVPTPVRNMIGCNMSYRKAIIDTVGNFSHEVGRVGNAATGDEETELCIRLRQKYPQMQMIHKPDARVKHKVPADRANWAYFRRRCSSEGRSKAVLSKRVGANDGLSSERSYTLKTLPTGLLHGLGDALKGDVSGLGRAWAIILGFSATALSYVWVRLGLLMGSQDSVH